MGLEEIHGLCCRFLLSADGDVVARLTESVCVTFRNGGRRAVGRNHFTPSSRESGSNIDNYTIFLKYYSREDGTLISSFYCKLQKLTLRGAHRRHTAVIPMVRQVQQRALATQRAGCTAELSMNTRCHICSEDSRRGALRQCL